MLDARAPVKRVNRWRCFYAAEGHSLFSPDSSSLTLCPPICRSDLRFLEHQKVKSKDATMQNLYFLASITHPQVHGPTELYGPRGPLTLSRYFSPRVRHFNLPLVRSSPKRAEPAHKKFKIRHDCPTLVPEQILRNHYHTMYIIAYTQARRLGYV